MAATSNLFERPIHTISEDMLSRVFELNPDRHKLPLGYSEGEYFQKRKTTAEIHEDYIRIGDVELKIPPEYISVRSTNQSESISSLRQSSSTKINTTKTKREIQIQCHFNGIEDINGYETQGPKTSYYVDGLRPLLAQLSTVPFIPVVNKLLNIQFDIFNLAFTSIQVITDPGYPNSLIAQITFNEMNTEAYTFNHEIMYGTMIDWDLFRHYYQRRLFKNDFNQSYFKPINFDLNALFNIYTLNESVINSDISRKEMYKDENYTLLLSNLEYAFTIGKMSGSMANMLTETYVSGVSNPTFQFMGSSDKVMSLNISTSDDRVISAFRLLEEKTNQVLLTHSDIKSINYIKIKNEFLQFMGIEYVIIKNIDINSVSGFPGLFDITLRCFEFQDSQKSKEEITSFKPFENDRKGKESDLISQDQKGVINKITQDYIAEQKIREMELYPDLTLPTYEELDELIANINGFRNANRLPSMKIQTYPREKYFGKYVDPDFYLFYPKFFDSRNGVDINEIEENEYKIDMSKFGEILYKETPFFGSKDFEYKGEDFDTSLERMFVDFKAEKRGRMIKAFPTYLFMILDNTNTWFKGDKMWTNYYVSNALLDVNIMHERNQPIGTAILNIANVYETITDTPINPGLVADPQKETFLYKTFGWHLGFEINSSLIHNKNVLLDQFKLSSGAKIHIRLGYGSNALEFPTNFNGRITSITHGKTVNIVAQSDGRELANIQYADKVNTTNKLTRLGNEASNIIMNILKNRQSFLATINNSYFEGSQFSIESFGVINKNSFANLFQFESNGYTEEAVIEKLKFLDGLDDTYSYKISANEDPNKIISNAEISYSSNDPYISNTVSANKAMNNLFSSGSTASSDDDLNSTLKTNFKTDMKEGYDLIKNIYLANYKKPVVCTDSDAGDTLIFDGEKNIKMKIGGITTWDLLKNIQDANPGFVCYPTYHQFDNRLFFGKPHWLYKFKYELDNPQHKPLEAIKSFQQWHAVDSEHDILVNEITADSSQLITNAITRWDHDNDIREGDILHADSTIDFANQKTKIFDSDLSGDLFLFDAVYEAFNLSPHLVNANSFSLSMMIESFNRMYTGDLIIAGNARIKPFDMIFINDNHKNMYGNVIARRVTHSLNFNTGFTTTIRPDLVTSGSDITPEKGGPIKYDNSVAISKYMNYIGRGLQTGILVRYTVKYVIVAGIKASYKLRVANANASMKVLYAQIGKKTLSAFYETKEMYKTSETFFDIISSGSKIGTTFAKTTWNVSTSGAKDLKKALSLAGDIKSLKKNFNRLKDYKDTYELIENLRDIGYITNNASEITKLLVSAKSSVTLVEGIKNIFAASKAGVMIGAINPIVLLFIIVEVFTEIFINKAVKWAKNRHTIIISPLFKNGSPFVLGIEGAQNLIPGFNYDSSLMKFVDENYVSVESNEIRYAEQEQNYTKYIVEEEEQTLLEKWLGWNGTVGAKEYTELSSENTESNNPNYSKFNPSEMSSKSSYFPENYSAPKVPKMPNNKIASPLKHQTIEDAILHVTSPYGDRWLDYNGDGIKTNKKHNGLDLALRDTKGRHVSTQIDIICPFNNAIVHTVSNQKIGFGNYCIIQNLDEKDLFACFAHMKNTASVKIEEKITLGDKIGVMGKSGLETFNGGSIGEHLHFEIRRKDERINPQPFFDKEVKFI